MPNPQHQTADTSDWKSETPSCNQIRGCWHIAAFHAFGHWHHKHGISKPIISCTLSKSSASAIYCIAFIITVTSVSSKDFSAGQSAVSAVPTIAAAFFSTGCSILHIKICWTLIGCSKTVLQKITYILDCSAECSRFRLCTVCTASPCFTNSTSLKLRVLLTAFVVLTLL